MPDEEKLNEEEEIEEESPADYIKEELDEVDEEVEKLDEIGKEAEAENEPEQEPPKEELPEVEGEKEIEEEPKEEINREPQVFKHNQETERNEKEELPQDKLPENVKNILPEEVKTGDYISFRGDKSISSISGRVLKANRVTLDIESDYMGKPMNLRVKRSDLRGEGRALINPSIEEDTKNKRIGEGQFTEDYGYHKTSKKALESIKQEGMTGGDFTVDSAIDFPGEVTLRVKTSDIPNPQIGEYGKGVKWYLPDYKEEKVAIPPDNIEVKDGKKWKKLNDYNETREGEGQFVEETLPEKEQEQPFKEEQTVLPELSEKVREILTPPIQSDITNEEETIPQPIRIPYVNSESENIETKQMEKEQVEVEKQVTWKEEEAKLYPKPRKSRRKRGTITYKDDNDEWVTVEPPYKYKRRQKYAPEGAYKTNRKAIQVIGGKPLGKTPAVDLGFAKIIMTPNGELIIEYRQGGEAGRVVREYIPPPTKAFRELGLRKVELPQYRAGNLRVYLVNGDYVRKHFNAPFVDGGNDKTLPSIIPHNEIWVEETPNVIRTKKNLLYQLINRRNIKQDDDYYKAHQEANAEIAKINNDILSLDRDIIFEVQMNPEWNGEKNGIYEYSKINLTKQGALRKHPRNRKKILGESWEGKYYLGHRLPESSLTGVI